MSLSPAQLQYPLEYAYGGVGRTIRRSKDIATALMEGTYNFDIESSEIPFQRRFTAGPKDWVDQEAYNDNVEDVKTKSQAYRTAINDF